jgi:hypothetical protein
LASDEFDDSILAQMVGLSSDKVSYPKQQENLAFMLPQMPNPRKIKT